MPDEDDDSEPTTDYACAGERHFEDASYLHGGGRLLNADHLFGLAVECLMKGLLLRFAAADGVSMTDRGGTEDTRLWWDDPGTNKRKPLGHIDAMLDALPLLLDGRPGPALTEALKRVSTDFEKWLVGDRYSDGNHLDPSLLARRQESAALAHDLHQHVLLTGKLP